ncbi:hypothetical protein [Nocardiopsis baichengensis]|uniref:hypothetical protein n=1 Tax=Nocardiopsis baichengensis TaxID=280240 RepID=UPI00034CB54B|nr:hypothetical protein [Nocardiopsis baichengensis]
MSDGESLHQDLRAIAWRWAPHSDADSPEEVGLNDRKEAYLARLGGLKALAQACKEAADGDARAAVELGASAEELGAAWGITRQAAAYRWPFTVRRGDRVAVVISRADRIRAAPQDRRGVLGEVGGAEQYDIDRGAWQIGAEARREAEYAIVAAGGTVRRIYRVDPAQWEQDPTTGKWSFAAVGDRPLSEPEVEVAYASGRLPLRPGDPCPTLRGGAYRPLWF